MPRGIICMIAATVLLAITAALAKWLVAIYPVGEVMFFRSFSSLVICAAFILPVDRLVGLRHPASGRACRRAACRSRSRRPSRVIAFMLMPLAGAIAISFSAPLWAALLSIVWLKERAGPARWIVLLAGFIGVLIVTNPGADSLQLGALFALANAVMYGSVTVAVRGHDEDRIRQYAADVADGDDRGLPHAPAAVRLPVADRGRRGDAGLSAASPMRPRNTSGRARCSWRRPLRSRRSTT